MKRWSKLAWLFVAVFAIFALTGCDAAEDAAEKALEELTDYDWELTEEDFEDLSGVNTPFGWDFIFAVNLEDAELAEQIDGSFSVDISPLEDFGLDFGDFDNQIMIGKVAAKGDTGGNGLRYANKILIDGGEIKLDGESIDVLGASVGSSGPGWYAAYHARNAVGFVKGMVTDCDGNAPPANTVLVLASKGPFFTFAAGNGSWALPSVDGAPAAVNFDAGDCTGSDSAPVTDEENPKDPEETPPQSQLEDGVNTNIVDAGETDLGNDDDPDPGAPSSGYYFEFDDEDTGWASTGDCFAQVTNAGDDYDYLFPAGADTDKSFGFISSGSPTAGGLQSCTVTRTFMVPDDTDTFVVSFDFLSQEYKEWVGSPYNDIFTVIIQGEYDYVVNRTVNGPNNWEFISNGGVIGTIADSVDAGPNAADSTPGETNGGNAFDGHLKWNGENDNTPRGDGNDDNVNGYIAEYGVEPGATITVLITVSDVADAIYDSAGVIDYVGFE
ncbi:MAG: choice-of-anchor L domain-containing protein [Candidatus Lernaella stagnicola]|nr:choice-of-anchor L domain-containing protein [Candidatus Lernaella stagnicola]